MCVLCVLCVCVCASGVGLPFVELAAELRWRLGCTCNCRHAVGKKKGD